MADANAPTTLVVGTVKAVSGTVEVLDKDGNVIRTLSKAGEEIYYGEILKTASDGSVTIVRDGEDYQIGPNITLPLSKDDSGLSPDIEALQKALLEGIDPSEFAPAEAGVVLGSAGGRSLFYVDWRPLGLEPGDTYPTSFSQPQPEEIEYRYWIVPYSQAEISLDKEACALNCYDFRWQAHHFEGRMMQELNSLFGEYNVDDIIARFCSGDQPWIDLYDFGVPNVGEPVLYTFRIENTGQSDLSDVVLNDNMAKLLIALNGGDIILGDGFFNGGDFSLISLGDLPVGQVAYAAGIYFLTQEDIDAGFKLNIADVTGTPPVGPPVSDEDPERIDLPQDPDIHLKKIGYLDKCFYQDTAEMFHQDSPAEFSQLSAPYFDPCKFGCVPYEGDTITYYFTVTNKGNVTLDNIELIDNMIDADNIELIFNGNGDDVLSPFEFWIYKGTYEITSEDIDAGFKKNTATVTGDSPMDVQVSDDDMHFQHLIQCPKITLEKVAIDKNDDGFLWNDNNNNGLADVGEKIFYKFTITNTGNTTLFNIDLDDSMATIHPDSFTGLEDLDGDGVKDDLAAGHIAMAEGWYMIKPVDVRKGGKYNKATVTGDSPKDVEVMAMDDEYVRFPTPLKIQTRDGKDFEDGTGSVYKQCQADKNTIAVKFNLMFNDSVDEVTEIRIQGIPEGAVVTNPDWINDDGIWLTNDATQIASFTNQSPFGKLFIMLPEHYDSDLNLTVSADKQAQGGGPIQTASGDIFFLIDAVAAKPEVKYVSIDTGDDEYVEACEVFTVKAVIKFCDINDNGNGEVGAERQSVCFKLPDGSWEIVDGEVTVKSPDNPAVKLSVIDLGNGLYEVDVTDYLDSLVGEPDMAFLNIKANVMAPTDLEQEIEYCYKDLTPYDIEGGYSGKAGQIKAINMSYNSASEKLSFQMKIDDMADGFTLALSPGDNPKGELGELALIYFDASDPANPVVTIYEYNGQNNASSYNNPGNLILSSISNPELFSIEVMQMGGNEVFSFMVDANAINDYLANPEWTGIEFGEQVGIWLHPVKGLSTDYDDNGALEQWSFTKQGWYDTTGDGEPTEVKETKPLIEVTAKAEDEPSDGEITNSNNQASDSESVEVCVKNPDPLLVFCPPGEGNPNTCTYQLSFDGLLIAVMVTETMENIFSVKIEVLEGHADINGFFWANGDDIAELDPNDVPPPLNMNGSGVAWDGFEFLSMPGLGNEPKETYLVAGSDNSSLMFDVEVDGGSKEDFALIGIRATSTSTIPDSIKGVGDAEHGMVCDDLMGGKGMDVLVGDLNGDEPYHENTIYGKEGDDLIFGDALADTEIDLNDPVTEIINYIKANHPELSGGPDEDRGADDKLFGNQGSDIIYGQGGDDLIVGGEDRDHLYGGGGEDTFAYSAGDGGDSIAFADVIYDFDTNEDKIGLIGGLTVNIFNNGADAVVEDASTSEVLAVIQNVDAGQVMQENVVL